MENGKLKIDNGELTPHPFGELPYDRGAFFIAWQKLPTTESLTTGELLLPSKNFPCLRGSARQGDGVNSPLAIRQIPKFPPCHC